jgi:hypothetical protein
VATEIQKCPQVSRTRATSQRASPTIGETTQNPANVFFIDIERIEGLSVPFQHPVMPFIAEAQARLRETP